jgi:hypothetical protein
MEIQQPVEQLDHPATALITARPNLFARQGSVSVTWRRRSGKTFGPYYRLSYRENGRQCAVYLGREGPVVQRVRQMLDALHAPLRQRGVWKRFDRTSRAHLRAIRAQLATLLRPLGLRLKGTEVRGWRTSPLRPWLPRRCSLPPGLGVAGRMAIPHIGGLPRFLQQNTTNTGLSP